MPQTGQRQTVSARHVTSGLPEIQVPGRVRPARVNHEGKVQGDAQEEEDRVEQALWLRYDFKAFVVLVTSIVSYNFFQKQPEDHRSDDRFYGSID